MMCTALVRRLVSSKQSMNFSRFMSDGSKFLSLTTLEQEKKGVAVLSMNKVPVNSLSLEFLTELKITLQKLEDERKVKGLILTSDLPNIFSAGLDIMEMYHPEEGRLRTFWSTLQDVFLTLYGTNLVTVAAINGNAPAGGCLLSLACDSRVMSKGKYTIGLNETLLGIVAPFWFKDIFIATIGHRQAEQGLQLGAMYTADHALRIGLVDELCEPEQLMSTAQQHLATYLAVPGAARALIKHQLHEPLLSKLHSGRNEDVNNFVSFITKDSVQASLGKYLEMLKSKKKKKKDGGS